MNDLRKKHAIIIDEDGNVNSVGDVSNKYLYHQLVLYEYIRDNFGDEPFFDRITPNTSVASQISGICFLKNSFILTNSNHKGIVEDDGVIDCNLFMSDNYSEKSKEKLFEIFDRYPDIRLHFIESIKLIQDINGTYFGTDTFPTDELLSPKENFEKFFSDSSKKRK